MVRRKNGVEYWYDIVLNLTALRFEVEGVVKGNSDMVTLRALLLSQRSKDWTDI